MPHEASDQIFVNQVIGSLYLVFEKPEYCSLQECTVCSVFFQVLSNKKQQLGAHFQMLRIFSDMGYQVAEFRDFFKGSCCFDFFS